MNARPTRREANGYSARDSGPVGEASVTETSDTRPTEGEAPLRRQSRLQRLMRYVPWSPPSFCGPCLAG
ncbi:hypothetical protein SNE510_76090 [Streptomyces sp. NE5-10]|nr:hypothetical protein SNE510_76090 [Streptomyces sp. NE5-10]